MPERPWRLLLVGCGQIARAYLAAISRVPGLTLCGLVDPREDARGQATRDTGAPGFPSVHAALAGGSRPDGALVLSPPDTHEALATFLLEQGVHVLCEKPLAPTVDAAARMLACARTNGRRLMMGSKFRYTADVLAAHDLLAAGFCGDVVLYENVFCSHVDMARRWNARPEISGGGVLIDNGCHAVDVARYLLGPLDRVQAWFARTTQAIAVEDTARLQFTSHSGAFGSVDLSWSLHKETPAYVRVHGTAGAIEIGWQESRRKRTSEAGWTVFGHGYDKIAAFAAQLEDFVACCRGEREPRIGDADALASVVVVDAAYRSQREMRWIELPGEDHESTAVQAAR